MNYKTKVCEAIFRISDNEYAHRYYIGFKIGRKWLPYSEDKATLTFTDLESAEAARLRVAIQMKESKP